MFLAMCLFTGKQGIISEKFSPIFDLRGFESSYYPSEPPPGGLGINPSVGGGGESVFIIR